MRYFWREYQTGEIREAAPLLDAWTARDKNEVLLLEDFVSKASTEQIAEALVEEYVHLSSGEADGSISFEKALVKSIVRLMYPRRVTVESL